VDGKQRRHDVMMQAKYNVKDELSDVKSLKMHMEKAAISWLNNEKRLDEWGITLDFQPTIDGYTQHKVQKKRHQIQFSSVDYQGMLTVQDPLKFINQYAKGFGRAKGMGCGLMMIKRA
jgi:CRISPR system Cascade subunit CasE